MACCLYLTGDEAPLFCDAPADVVLDQLSLPGAEFVPIKLVPFVRGEPNRTAYVRPESVAAILPLDTRELEHMLDHPPEWLA